MTRRRLTYLCFVAIVGAVLVASSGDIGSLNQTDFSRAIDFMLLGPADHNQPVAYGPPVLEWVYQPRPGSPLSAYNTSSLYFWAIGLIQRAFSETYHVTVLAIASKCIVLVGCAGAAAQYASRAGMGLRFAMLAYMLLALCFFMPQPSFIFASFYQEHLFYVAFPFLIWALFESVPWRADTLLTLSLLACGAAKTQYFYMSALLLVVILAVDFLCKRRPSTIRIVLLVVVQVACMLPIHDNYERKFNLYHSLFFGSYLFVSPENADRAGVTASNESCIGIDAWGAKIEGSLLDHTSKPHSTCFRRLVISPSDVVRPYLVEPNILATMWKAASPAHWTAFPFHVDRSVQYIVSAHGHAAVSDQALMQLGRIRERFITPHYVLIPVAACCMTLLLWLWTRQDRPLKMAIFLVLLGVSQVFVALLGEGIRDLSKHVMVAQLCLDQLSALLALTVGSMILRIAARRRGVHVPDAS